MEIVLVLIMGCNKSPTLFIGKSSTLQGVMCVCFLPIHSGHQVRWTYQPGSHRRKVTQEEGRTDFSSTFLLLRCVCVCVFSSHSFWTSKNSLDVPAGVTQEEGHTVFLIHLPSAVRALIFLARWIQPFLSLVDREVKFCVLTI